jgi:MFS family permease
MTQMTPQQIAAALEAGIISKSQAEAMRAPLHHNQSHDSAAIGDEDNMRFIRGFSDIFIAIGIGLLLGGMSALAAIFGGGAAYIGAAIATAFMADYFGRKKRSHLPTLLTALAFLIFTLRGLSGLIGGGGVGGDILTAIVTLAAMGVFYWRVRLPFCVALMTLAALYLGFTLLKAAAPMLASEQFGWVMALGGLITLIGGIYYDSQDLHRTTRFSDNAFWLHLTAAPLLIHGAVLELVKTQTTQILGLVPMIDIGQGDAVTMLILVAIVSLIGLILNRRALIISALIYAVIAVGYLFAKSGMGLSMALTLTLLLVGAAIVLLGVGWHPLRNRIIKALPKSRFIPIPYDPSFKK